MVRIRHRYLYGARDYTKIKTERNAMNTLTFLLSTLLSWHHMVLLLRVWMQWARCDFTTLSPAVRGENCVSSDRCVVLSRQWGRLRPAAPCWWRLFLALLRR